MFLDRKLVTSMRVGSQNDRVAVDQEFGRGRFFAKRRGLHFYFQMPTWVPVSASDSHRTFDHATGVSFLFLACICAFCYNILAGFLYLYHAALLFLPLSSLKPFFLVTVRGIVECNISCLVPNKRCVRSGPLPGRSGYSGQSLPRLAISAGWITVHECMRKHSCTLYSPHR